MFGDINVLSSLYSLGDTNVWSYQCMYYIHCTVWMVLMFNDINALSSLYSPDDYDIW